VQVPKDRTPNPSKTVLKNMKKKLKRLEKSQDERYELLKEQILKLQNKKVAESDTAAYTEPNPPVQKPPRRRRRRVLPPEVMVPAGEFLVGFFYSPPILFKNRVSA